MRRVIVFLATAIVVAGWLPPVQAATTQRDGSSAGADSHGSPGVMSATTTDPVLTRTAVPRASAKGSKGQTLTVTPTGGLSALGQTVKVRGRGFSELVGIYVGLCVMPRAGTKPTPCGGGVDQDGSSQASAWISSNPPPYGANLAVPYKRGGKFSVRIKVSPRIGAYDCRVVRCAVVARADHTRANDRAWDVAVPVTFR
jgi:hypothetical protein